jgi:hypothetical protein
MGLPSDLERQIRGSTYLGGPLKAKTLADSARRFRADAPGVDRDAIHTKTVRLAEEFFARCLR